MLTYIDSITHWHSVVYLRDFGLFSHGLFNATVNQRLQLWFVTIADTPFLCFSLLLFSSLLMSWQFICVLSLFLFLSLWLRVTPTSPFSPSLSCPPCTHSILCCLLVLPVLNHWITPPSFHHSFCSSFVLDLPLSLCFSAKPWCVTISLSDI